MRWINFNVQMLSQLIKGSKTTTIRRKRLAPDIYRIKCSGRPTRYYVRILGSRPIKLCEITDEVAWREGFSSTESLIRYLSYIYRLPADFFGVLWIHELHFAEIKKLTMFDEKRR